MHPACTCVHTHEHAHTTHTYTNLSHVTFYCGKETTEKMQNIALLSANTVSYTADSATNRLWKQAGVLTQVPWVPRFVHSTL